jgi:hypothetical protein
MWEKTTKIDYIDKDGNHVTGSQTEGGPSWYDYILDFPVAIRYCWYYFGLYIFLVPFLILIVIPCILLRDWWNKPKDF